MTHWSDYHLPRTLEAALQALEADPGSALIAGGTDLLLDLEQGRHPAVNSLIDLNRIEELQRLESSDGNILIGAAVPLAHLIQNAHLIRNAPGLVEACELIGGPQVRNVATLGGNVGHALPAGDGTIALLSLDAEAQLISASAQQWVPLLDIFAGPGEVTFDRRKVLIAAFKIKERGQWEGSAFRRVMRPQGVAIAIMNMAVWLRCDEEGRIIDARLALGPGGPTPFCSVKGSDALIGESPSEQILQKVSEAILAEAKFRTSRFRSTRAYREHLVLRLLRDTVLAAHERALDYPRV